MRSETMILAAVLSALALSGCSVYRALNMDAPEIRNLQVGMERAVLEAELGAPISRSLARPGAVVDIYEYRRNPNPSAWRAVGHGIRSLFTFGIWEYLVARDNREPLQIHRMRVIYDSEGKVSEIRELDSYRELQAAE